MQRDSNESETFNLVRHCIDIANVKNTFVTCIQVNCKTQDQDCFRKNLQEKASLSDTQNENILQELVI